MTSWSPDIAHLPGPRYLAIAEAIAGDVRAGRLPIGSRLPTHRDLAWRLKVTVGTVSRAYAEAEKRGLIAGEVGRGTFVRPAGGNAVPGITRIEPDAPDFIDLGVNFPFGGSEPKHLAQTLADLSGSTDLTDLLLYHPSVGRPVDRAAGAAWIARSGVPAKAAQVIVTSGGQQGIAGVLASLTQPGDSVAVEALTYPGMKAAANLLSLRLVPIAIDDQGIDPDAFAAACRSGPIKALYVIPSLQNPTTSILPLDRRQALVEIARREGVAIIEDDVYGFLLDRPPPPLAALAPESVFYLTSASKSLAPGLRVGYIHAPSGRIDRLAVVIRATTYMATPLTAAVTTRWINDGTADALVAEKRSAVGMRHDLVDRHLDVDRPGFALRTHREAYHVWITLPDAWDPGDFTAAARHRGVGVTSSVAFAVGRGGAPRAIRLSLGTPIGLPALSRALAIVGGLMHEENEAHLGTI